jgi:hypothetical protein
MSSQQNKTILQNTIIPQNTTILHHDQITSQQNSYFQKLIMFIKNNWIWILLIIIFHFLFFKYNISDNKNIKTLFSFYGSCAFITSIISIYIQIRNQSANLITTQINYFNTIIDAINLNIYDYFTKNSSMQYYYNELYYNISDYNENTRNKYLEKIISMKILSNIDSVINYIDSFRIINGESFQIVIAEEKLLNLLKLFFKSKIFIEHWTFFKENIALQWTVDYIELNLDL